MMFRVNCIKLLPEQVANQIAAGEVVERPASVVKELVENALDADATRINVEVQAGGRSLIRVSDDGSGMSRDDALMCLERHATSKITSAGDLATISTMGFRGEAVPSIASVSRFTLTSRLMEQEAATQVIINGGKMISVKEAGAASGTEVEVRSLFYNLPARRKFMRTEETERAHVQQVLTLAALGNPKVAFSFTHNGRSVWRLPAESGGAAEALKRRLKELWGEGLRLVALDTQDELTKRAFDELGSPAIKVRLWGFIGAPGVSRSSREHQHVFVNRRPVENRGLNFALKEGYHTALMKGRFPVCCLFLEIDPGEVDVNIHPAKREVKFHREREVRRFVAETIQGALQDYHEGSREVAHAPTLKVGSDRIESAADIALKLDTTPPRQTNGTSHLSEAQPAAEQGNLAMGFASTPTPTPRDDAPPLTQGAASAQPLLSVPLRLVGVVGKLYVVLESDRGLVLMDQHAAHERVLFEEMMTRMEAKDTASQKLLLPETVELAPRDSEFVNSNMETLGKLGIGLGEFGERTFLLDALPPFVKVKDAKEFVLTMIDELRAAGQSVNSMRLGEDTVAKTVCRHAVKANDPLAEPELDALLENLRHCTMPYTCPHGRPTLIEMSYGELEKKFGRAV
jgi:DNA mismatch repair protein MutL